MMTPRTSQQGFNLIELMIASLVGLIMVAGTMQMFSSTKQSSQTSTAVTRMQENGRAGLFFLENAIRLSGYRPSSLEEFSTTFPGTSRNFDAAEQVIKGFDNDSVNGNNVLDDTDWIVMRYQGNDDEIIRDCTGAWARTGYTIELAFKVNDDKQLVCASDPALKPPSDPACARPANTAPSIECAPSADLTPDPDLADTDNWEVLVDGIEDMQLLYGVDTDSDFNANFYAKANQIPAGSEVVSVRISLLLQSDDLIATQAQTYQFNGQTVNDPGDRRLRKVFNSTTAVRNLVD